MKRRIALTLFFLAGGTACFAGQERQISLDEVPAQLRQVSSGLLEGFALQHAQIETETDGTEVYELIGIHEGIETEVDLMANGEVQEYEKVLPEEYVPFAVRKAILKNYPGIVFQRFEASHNKHHKVVKYEIVARYNNKPIDLEVSPDGRTITESDA